MKRIFLIITAPLLAIAATFFAIPQNARAAGPPPLIIRASPGYPAAFQRVNLSIVVPRGEIASDARIDWYVNGVEVASTTDYTYYSFRTGAAGNVYKIAVDFDGTQLYHGELTLKPYLHDISEGDNFTRSLECTADTLNMMANNLDSVGDMVTASVKEINAMQDQMRDDAEFIAQTADQLMDDINNDLTDLANVIYSLNLSFDTGSLRTAAMLLRRTVTILTKGATIQRYKHLQQIITRYETMQATIQMKIDARLRYLQNMQDQTNRQLALCEAQYRKINTSLNR